MNSEYQTPQSRPSCIILANLCGRMKNISSLIDGLHWNRFKKSEKASLSEHKHLTGFPQKLEQVAQWATIAHLRASIMLETP